MVSKETYKQVWFAMDACNSSGVIHSLDKWVDEIWKEARELGRGTDYVNSHPIIVIVADKLRQLAELASDKPDTLLSDSYQRVLERSEGE